MKNKIYIKSVTIITIMILVTLLCGCNISVNTQQATEKEKPALNDTLLSETEYPFYMNTMDNESTIKLYFADEAGEIPYIDAETAGMLIDRMFCELNNDEDYMLTVSEDEGLATLTRENGYTMTIDSERDTIDFPDYDEFFAPTWSVTAVETLEHYGAIEYVQVDGEKSYSRNGSPVELELGNYGIDIIGKDGKCYIPLQTLSDIALAGPCYVNLVYNKNAVFAYEIAMEPDKEIFSNINKAGPGKRSRRLADFTYNEFCMVLDYFYGLKEQQGIECFDEYFAETGLKDRLLDEDPGVSENAVADFLNLYLDDLHSSYAFNSYLAGGDFKISENYGSSRIGLFKAYGRLMEARQEQYPDGVPGYEETGNTAFVTFDVFDTLEEGADYYEDPPAADTKDTVGLLLYAFEQITRKDSPVENVVFDLSLNTGGDQTTTSFMLSMILGGSSLVFEDTMTGAYSYESFKADANLDGIFDEKDSLAGYNPFCIMSPVSFSCANMAASELKNSYIVTMLGQTSGGGTCAVMPLSLADGTLIVLSGNKRISYMKNGSVYNIDLGIEPDLYISKPSAYYDRKALTEYINSNMH